MFWPNAQMKFHAMVEVSTAIWLHLLFTFTREIYGLALIHKLCPNFQP